MRKLIYKHDTFQGINTELPASTGTVLKATNVDQVVDTDSASSKYYGFLKKIPSLTQIGDTVGTTSSRGLYTFLSSTSASTGVYYIQAFSDKTVRYLSPVTSLWTTIFTGSSDTEDLQYDFETYNDTLFFTNGTDLVQKWKVGWAASKNIVDLGSDSTVITGHVFTLVQGSNEVTCVEEDVTSHIEAGDWLQLSDDKPWYEVDSVTFATDTSIILTSNYLGDGAIGVPLYKAANSTITARFITVFKDRLYYASGDDSLLPLCDVMLTYDDADDGGTLTYPAPDPDSPFIL
jgi:hypothetical protein